MGRWTRRSLRVRVISIAAVAVAVGLSLAGVVLVLSLRAGLLAGLDDAEQSRAVDAVGAVQRDDLTAAVVGTGGDSTLVQVLGPDGSVLTSSPALRGIPPLVGARPRREVGIDERDFRVVTNRVGDRIVVVLSPLSDVQQSTTQLVSRLLVGGPVLLALICTAIWVLVGYPLRTVDRLRSLVAELSATGLDRRVDIPVAQDEVRRLAVTMNDLLDRLQRAAEAQRRFVADAAHELRNPLSALRARLEVTERSRRPAGSAPRRP